MSHLSERVGWGDGGIYLWEKMTAVDLLELALILHLAKVFK